jgi:hypothetical protein
LKARATDGHFAALAKTVRNLVLRDLSHPAAERTSSLPFELADATKHREQDFLRDVFNVGVPQTLQAAPAEN